MINQRWEKRLLRAKKADVISSVPIPEIDAWEFSCDIKNRECEMKNCVKDNEKIMSYLQNENHSGHAHNLDMLLSSINLNQHLREAFLSAEVIEDAENNCYTLSFPFGTKMIEFKLSKKAVDGA